MRMEYKSIESKLFLSIIYCWSWHINGTMKLVFILSLLLLLSPALSIRFDYKRVIINRYFGDFFGKSLGKIHSLGGFDQTTDCPQVSSKIKIFEIFVET